MYLSLRVSLSEHEIITKISVAGCLIAFYRKRACHENSVINHFGVPRDARIVAVCRLAGQCKAGGRSAWLLETRSLILFRKTWSEFHECFEYFFNSSLSWLCRYFFIYFFVFGTLFIYWFIFTDSVKMEDENDEHFIFRLNDNGSGPSLLMKVCIYW